MPHVWIWFALAFYAAGMVEALLALGGWRKTTPRWLAPTMTVGALYHFVALTEGVLQSGQVTPVDLTQSESVLAFMLTAVFLSLYVIFKTEWHGVLIAPLIFLLTLASAIGTAHEVPGAATLPPGAIYLHIALIFTGYAALLFSSVTSVLYLVQEKNLKNKTLSGSAVRLPALAVLDNISGRALQLGFPFMTLGLAAGVVTAGLAGGPMSVLDPRILLSVMMWLLYLFLLFMRWKAGMRGRNAAVLSLIATFLAACSWAVHYLSTLG